MNTDRVDKLFADKLSHYEATPSPEAWVNLQAQMQEHSASKSFRKAWYAIAASIALVAVAVGALLTLKPISESQPSTLTQTQEVLTEPMDIPLLKQGDTPVSTSDEAMTAQEVSHTEETKSAPVPQVTVTETAQPSIAEEMHVARASINIQPGVMSIARVTPSIHPISTETLPIYDIPFTDKSRFAKAMDYALRVKNGEESLFNLRKAKDDLFDLAKNVRVKSDNSDLNMD